MFKIFHQILEDITKGRKVTPDDRNDDIVLKIVAHSKTIAYLSTEDSGNVFTLVYIDNFLTSGVPPFNMRFSEKPEIGKIYKSEVLWYAFAARVPNPSRPDFPSGIR